MCVAGIRPEPMSTPFLLLNQRGHLCDLITHTLQIGSMFTVHLCQMKLGIPRNSQEFSWKIQGFPGKSQLNIWER